MLSELYNGRKYDILIIRVGLNAISAVHPGVAIAREEGLDLVAELDRGRR